MNEYNNLTLEQINNALKTLSTAELSCMSFGKLNAACSRRLKITF